MAMTQSLRAAIAAQSRLLQRPVAPLGRPATADAAQAIVRRVGAIAPPPLLPGPERTALAERFHHAAQKNLWDGIGADDWDDVWQVLWGIENPLLAISRFETRYRRWLEASASSRPFKRLIHAYLSEFGPDRQGLEWAAKLLRKTILQQKFADLELWREYDFRCEIFSVELGPKRIAQTVLQAGTGADPLALLAEVGLGEPLLTRGLARAAYRHALERVSEKGKAPEPVLAAFVSWSLGGPGGTLLFPDLRKELYCAVLAEWHGSPAPAPILRLLRGFMAGYEKPAEGEPSADGFGADDLGKIDQMRFDLE